MRTKLDNDILWEEAKLSVLAFLLQSHSSSFLVPFSRYKYLKLLEKSIKKDLAKKKYPYSQKIS